VIKLYKIVLCNPLIFIYLLIQRVHWGSFLQRCVSSPTKLCLSPRIKPCPSSARLPRECPTSPAFTSSTKISPQGTSSSHRTSTSRSHVCRCVATYSHQTTTFTTTNWSRYAGWPQRRCSWTNTRRKVTSGLLPCYSGRCTARVGFPWPVERMRIYSEDRRRERTRWLVRRNAPPTRGSSLRCAPDSARISVRGSATSSIGSTIRRVRYDTWSRRNYVIKAESNVYANLPNVA